MLATTSQVPHQEKILLEQIKTLYQSMWSLLSINLLVSLSLTVAFWGKVPANDLISWMAAMLLMLAVRAVIYLRYRSGFDPSQTEQYKRFIIIGSACAGVVWGAGGVLLFPADSFDYQLFLLLSLLAMSVGSAFSLSIYLPAYYAYVPLTLLPIAIKLFSLDGTIYLTLGAVTVVFLVAMTSFNIRLNQNFTKSLLLRYENLDLIEQLQQQKIEADRANNAKSKFLAAASHDLRQPLYSLGLFTSVLDELIEAAEPRKVVGQIHRSVDALQSLFDKLLDISQLDAGVIEANKTAMPLASVFNVLAHDFDAAAAAKGLAISWPSDTIFVHSEPVLLEQILRNFITNAIRYTASGGITVSVISAGDRVTISVTDTGQGIPADSLQDIFVEFHQLENSERDREKGLGLGLSIVQRTAELLEHTVAVESVAGQGSTFSVTMDKAVSAPLVQAQRKESSKRVVFDKRTLVVIVDDEVGIREGMGQLLQLWGCAVITAENAASAIEQLTAAGREPSAIISDFRLRDDETGIGVIGALHGAYHQAIPAILITGDIEKDRLLLMGESGFEVLYKPVPPNKLRDFLEAAVTTVVS